MIAVPALNGSGVYGIVLIEYVLVAFVGVNVPLRLVQGVQMFWFGPGLTGQITLPATCARTFPLWKIANARRILLKRCFILRNFRVCQPDF
jgi:hypothetical protein